MSTYDRPSYSSIIIRLFPNGGEKKSCAAFFLHESVGGAQGMSVEFFARKLEHVTCLCSTLLDAESGEKTGSCTKAKSFEGNIVYYSFLLTKVQMSTPFLRGRP